MIEIKKLKVEYNDRVVGYLVEIEKNKIAFQYDEEWITEGFSISPFSLPLKHDIFISSKDTFEGLFGVFYDSLPDGWGELLVSRMLAKNGIDINKLSPLTKLSLLSNNGLGGLSYIPTQANNDSIATIDFDYYAKEAAKILNDDVSVGLDKLYHFGGSSGGTRPKAHVKINGEEWIVKFPTLIDPQDVGKKEYEANCLAQKCGICTNEFELFSSKEGSGYFGAKRFDRKGNKRIHMISLSGILETTHRIPNLDYMHLFKVIQKICVNQEDLKEAFRRMCFNVFYKNKDDHGKNFSFLYDDEEKGYRLSPCYDITSTPFKVEHEMSIYGSGNPKEEDLLAVAKAMNLSMQWCKEEITKIKNILL